MEHLGTALLVYSPLIALGVVLMYVQIRRAYKDD